VIKIEVDETLRAPIDAVFEQLVDHENYASFDGVSSSRLTRVGVGERNGVGAQRRIRLGAVVLWEDIVAFERPTLLEYRIVKQRPPLVRHVLGRVRLTQTDEGTRAVWTSELEIPVPLLGRVLEGVVARKFDAAFRAMLREMERRAAR
jgi:uncharacterized protein YndB with AHSA1/START domain